MKLCIDCKHYRPHTVRVLWIKADHPEYARCALDPSPIDGKPDTFCSLSREYGPCKKSGVLWEAKDG